MTSCAYTWLCVVVQLCGCVAVCAQLCAYGRACVAVRLCVCSCVRVAVCAVLRVHGCVSTQPNASAAQAGVAVHMRAWAKHVMADCRILHVQCITLFDH